MSSELEASRLISASFDRELTESELDRLSALLSDNPRARNIKQALEALRQIAQGPTSLEANAVNGNHLLPPEARERIQNALDDALNEMSTDQVRVSRQLRDVAFASVLLGEGRVSEGELISAVGNWTAYGNESLADHLTESRVLDVEEAAEFESLAGQALVDTAVAGESSDSADETASGSIIRDSESLQRIANLLGLGHVAASNLAAESRQVGAEYRLIRKLGQGGLGSVWLARDEKLKRNVAVKEISKGESASDSTIKRFQRKAQVTGQLEHPNIVSVYQYGEDESSGKLFYAMRFVGKTTLREAIAEYHQRKHDGIDTAADLSQLLSAFQTVCQAVGFAHSRGVVHRDLKPENVALDGFGQVIVIDWGLAKVFGEPEYLDAKMATGPETLQAAEQTVAGQVLGTPHYMSPEQAAGRIDEVDERTDVYGLGAILFTILTGRAPHDVRLPEGSRSSKIDKLLTQIVRSETPVAHEIDEDIPIELSKICSRAMAKHKYGRFGSAVAVGDAVQQWVAGIEKRTRLFEEFKSQARELEVRISSAIQDIIRNARFIATLPPIQGIIDSSLSREGAESVEVWQNRLETIFDGLVRTSRDTLAITFLSVTDGNAKEVARVERNPNDMSFIRSTPTSRLCTWEDSELISGVAQLEPGDTCFGIAESLRQTQRRRSGKRLICVLPVFDRIDGEPFGAVAIETDAAQLIHSAVSFSKRSTSCVLIADSSGTIWFDDTRGSDGQSVRHVARSTLSEEFPQLSTIFQSNAARVDDGRSFVARQISLGEFDEDRSLVIIVRTRS